MYTITYAVNTSNMKLSIIPMNESAFISPISAMSRRDTMINILSRSSILALYIAEVILCYLLDSYIIFYLAVTFTLVPRHPSSHPL
jgi:hypothetical protein